MATENKADARRKIHPYRDEIQHVPGIMDVFDHIIVLDHGRKIADGSPQVIRSVPRVRPARRLLAPAWEVEEHATEAASWDNMPLEAQS